MVAPGGGIRAQSPARVATIAIRYAGRATSLADSDVEAELDRITTVCNTCDMRSTPPAKLGRRSPAEPQAMRRAAVYLRISLDATGEGLAVDRQRKECQRILDARGWQLAGEYVDNSISASDAKKNRPAYARLVADFEAGQFDALVCYDLDRLTRQPRQLEDWIDAAESRGLALVTANGEADLTTDGGRLFARIRLAVARAEVERKSARQRSAARQRADLGRPPLGVRLTGYTTKGDLVPDEAALVRRIFTDFLDAKNLRTVARALDAAGLHPRRGEKWHPSTLQGILRNPRYAGRAIYQGEETGERGAWPAIVTDDDYETAQAILDDPTRTTNVSGSTERKHLGSGLYLCAVCREPVSSWSGGRYRCRNGAHVNRSRGVVDHFVTEVIAARLAQPDVADLLAPTEASHAPLIEQISRLRERLTRNDSDYDAGYVDGRRYKAARDKAEGELREAQAALAQAQAGSVLSGLVGAADPAEAFREAPLSTRRAVVDALATVLLRSGTRYSRVFDPETVQVEWR
jgi:site-specific DNA recombinase